MLLLRGCTTVLVHSLCQSLWPAMSASLDICVGLWDTHSVLLLVEHGNGKAAVTSIGPGQRSMAVWAHWAWLQWPGWRNPSAGEGDGHL